MNRQRILNGFFLALIALSLSACGTFEVGVEPAATPVPAATIPPAATATQSVPQPTSAPTEANPTALPPATAAPTAEPPTPEPPTPVAPPAPTAAPTQATVDRVKVFLIALEDNGQAGPAVGCGDSVVAIEREVPPTSEPLKAALQELFKIKEQFYGQSGLYNALYQSDLRIDGVTLTGGKATVRLSGNTRLGGVCDDPRFVAQIRETVLQFRTVQDAIITVNGVPLEQFLSEKG